MPKEVITSKPVPDTTSLLNEKADNKESIKDDSQKDKPEKEENIETRLEFLGIEALTRLKTYFIDKYLAD